MNNNQVSRRKISFYQIIPVAMRLVLMVVVFIAFMPPSPFMPHGARGGFLIPPSN